MSGSDHLFLARALVVVTGIAIIVVLPVVGAASLRLLAKDWQRHDFFGLVLSVLVIGCILIVAPMTAAVVFGATVGWPS